MPNTITRGLGIFGRIQTGSLLVGGAEVPSIFGNSYYVDGSNGADTNEGKTWKTAKATIQAAVTAASAGDSVYVRPKTMAAGATDPSSYAETVTIAAGKSRLRLIGIGPGPTQGGLPQLRIGSGTTAMLTVRSPGCLISGLGFNGASSTGGGILLDDDGSTKSAFGTVIENCHFKNCKGHATDSRLGGGVTWAATGGAWQVLISNSRFFDNVGGIVLVGTTGSRPKDVVVADCRFGGTDGSAVDSYIYGAGGSGFNDISILRCIFDTALPSIGAGSVLRYVSLTGVASGIIAGCYFASDAGTFGAAGNAGLVPVTVGLQGNYIESGLLARS